MKFNPGINLLLKGVVGSQAFGLASEDSDYDYQGMFFVPTVELLKLSPDYKPSYKFENPDTTYHEVGKYCSLALGCNPTVLDLLWLDQYNVRTQLGTELINLRHNFLSAKYVRDAYFGYATSQLGKLGKDPRPEKRAKNARHFYRILHQGWQLYSTGTYTVRLDDPQKFIDFGKEVAKDPTYAKPVMAEYEEKFNGSASVLPEKANREPVEAWLLKVRNEFYRYEDRDFTSAMGKCKTWP